MSGDHGASHDFSKRRSIRKRRSSEKCPYSITIKVGEQDMDRLDVIRAYYQEEMPSISWDNISMLIRQSWIGEESRISELKAVKAAKAKIKEKNQKLSEK